MRNNMDVPICGCDWIMLCIVFVSCSYSSNSSSTSVTRIQHRWQRKCRHKKKRSIPLEVFWEHMSYSLQGNLSRHYVIFQWIKITGAFFSSSFHLSHCVSPSGVNVVDCRAWLDLRREWERPWIWTTSLIKLLCLEFIHHPNIVISS